MSDQTTRPRCAFVHTEGPKAGTRCGNRPLKKTNNGLCKQHQPDPENRGGRQAKVRDPNMRKQLETALATGATRKACAIYAGISESSFYAYMERGEADQQAGIQSDYTEFLEMVTRAEARAEVTATIAIKSAMTDSVDAQGRTIPGDWRAAAFFLERRNPNEWGRVDAHKIKHSGTVRTDVPEVPESDERLTEVAEVLRETGVIE